MDAYDYEYDDEYYHPEPKATETPLTSAPESQPAKETPKLTEKPNANALPKPKEVPKEVPKEPEPEPEPEAQEIVLEQYDDWEQAMDALEAAVCKQEELRAIQKLK